MKTFKKWFDTKSEETQQYLLKNCLWIDKNSPDRYRHPKNQQEVKEQVMQYASSRFNDDNYVDSDRLQQMLAAYLQCDKLLKESDPNAYYDLLTVLWKNAQTEVEMTIDAMDLREVYKRNHNVKKRWPDRYKLGQVLLVTEDFDNVDWDLLDDGMSLNDVTMDIFGHDRIIEIAKRNPSMVHVQGTNINNDLFDELFFCKDGWTKAQKEDIIKDWNLNTDGVRDFIKRVVAVDESYLRYIGTYFINNEPALAAHLYKEKKSFDELNALPAGHNQADEYRYPKHYRKLFHIAACCARGNVGKAMAGTIGDVACMLKMYAYNFNSVFDCMYPQYAETSETSEDNEEATVV